jgi:hypothetical protein
MDLWVKPVILNEVKDLRSLRDSSPAAQNDTTHSTDFWDTTLVPFPLFMATLPFRTVATIAIRDGAQIPHIKLERH